MPRTSTLSNMRSPIWELARTVVHRLRDLKSELLWRRGGCPAPAPPHIKRQILRKLAHQHGLRVMVETGTFYGDTLYALRNCFDQLHSIELSPGLYQRAKERFADDPRIHLWFGDSGEVLADVLKVVDQPALFWLDGHYSGGPTAMGAEETPIVRELSLLSQHPLRSSILIVIDDARLFNGSAGYPPLQSMRADAEKLGFARFQVANDMILVSAVKEGAADGWRQSGR